MKGQIGKVFLFGIPLILIVIIGVLLFVLNGPLSVQTKTQTANTQINKNPSDYVNINSTPVSTPNTSGFPQIVYKSVQIPYGLSLPQALGVNFFTGVVNKAAATNDTLTLDVSDPTHSGSTYTFHFPKFVGIAEMTDPNQLQVDIVSTPASEAVQKLTTGKYISIKFDMSSKLNSISDMTNNEAGLNKYIIIYSFIK